MHTARCMVAVTKAGHARAPVFYSCTGSNTAGHPRESVIGQVQKSGTESQCSPHQSNAQSACLLTRSTIRKVIGRQALQANAGKLLQLLSARQPIACWLSVLAVCVQTGAYSCMCCLPAIAHNRRKHAGCCHSVAVKKLQMLLLQLSVVLLLGTRCIVLLDAHLVLIAEQTLHLRHGDVATTVDTNRNSTV